MNQPLKTILDNQKDFLKFLKTRYKVIHQSNLFFRDLHYGVMAFLEMNGKKYTYVGAEQVTRELIAELEKGSILKKMDERTWLLQYPEFKLVSTKPPAPAKPAGAAPRPATDTPKPTTPAILQSEGTSASASSPAASA
jgi:hypothetical protein